MRKYSIGISVAAALFMIFLTAGSSFSAEYKKIGHKTIHWKRYTIQASEGWLGAGEKTKYKLIYNAGDEYGAIVLSNTPSSLSEKQYQEFLPAIYKKLAGNPIHKDVILQKRTPYSVLDIENAPAVIFLAKGKKFFTFTPYINHHVYTVVAISWHKNSEMLPDYMVDMLNNIHLTFNDSPQGIAKTDTAVNAPNKALPIKTSENISNKNSNSSSVKQRQDTAPQPVRPHHKTIKGVPAGTCYAKYFEGLTAENADLKYYDPARNGKKAYSITTKGGSFVIMLYGDDKCFTTGKWKAYWSVGEEQGKYDLIDKNLTTQAITNFTADAPKIRQRLLDDLSKAEKAALDYKSTQKRFKDIVKWDSGGYKLELSIKSTSVQTVKLLVTIN